MQVDQYEIFQMDRVECISDTDTVVFLCVHVIPLVLSYQSINNQIHVYNR